MSTLPAVNSEQMKFLETGVNKRQPANAIQLSQPQLKYDDSNISNISIHLHVKVKQRVNAVIAMLGGQEIAVLLI